MRDPQNIDDIPGTRPIKRKHLDIQTRDVMKISDIEGARAKHQHPERKPLGERRGPHYDPMNYRDVTHCEFKTGRSTNPLMPSYTIRDEDNKLTEIGSVKGSIPHVLPPPRKDTTYSNLPLRTNDILGCTVGTKGLGNFHSRERRGFKNTNITADIFGA